APCSRPTPMWSGTAAKAGVSCDRRQSRQGVREHLPRHRHSRHHRRRLDPDADRHFHLLYCVMTPCIIMDIDGTLANAAHRIHLLPKSQGFEKTGLTPDEGWQAFYDEAKNDTVNAEIRELNNITGRIYEIMIVTGRPENER